MLFYDRTDHEDYRLVPSGAPRGDVCGKLTKAMAVAVAVFVHQAERLRGVVIAWCGAPLQVTFARCIDFEKFVSVKSLLTANEIAEVTHRLGALNMMNRKYQ